MIYLGFDLGGTKLRGYQVNVKYHNNQLSEAALVENIFSEPELMIKSFNNSDELNKKVFDSIKRFGDKQNIIVSASIAGLTDEKTLEAKCANIPFPIRFLPYLKEKGYNCHIFNDLFSAGTSLARLGPGKNYSKVSILNAGTGNNIACARDGTVYTYGTEAGHTPYIDGGIFCGCDGHGHLESYASGNGAATMALTYFKNHPNNRSHRILVEALNDWNLENKKDCNIDKLKNNDFWHEIVFSIQGKHVMNAYSYDKEENPQKEIRRLVRNAISVELGQINNLYRPELIIIRGSFVTENWNILGKPSIKRFIENYPRFCHPAIPMPKIEPKKVKKDGVIGAVLCAIDKEKFLINKNP